MLCFVIEQNSIRWTYSPGDFLYSSIIFDQVENVTFYVCGCRSVMCFTIQQTLYPVGVFSKRFAFVLNKTLSDDVHTWQRCHLLSNCMKLYRLRKRYRLRVYAHLAVLPSVFRQNLHAFTTFISWSDWLTVSISVLQNSKPSQKMLLCCFPFIIIHVLVLLESKWKIRHIDMK